jgi:hypothetical protein
MPVTRAEHAMKSPPTLRVAFIGYSFTAHDHPHQGSTACQVHRDVQIYASGHGAATVSLGGSCDMRM